MSPEKIAAERDCLLQALKRAEEEISKARSAQKQAEAKLTEILRTRGGAAAAPASTPAPARNDASQATVVHAQNAVSQAQTAQKRAETAARTFEDQLRALRAEHDQLQATLDSLKAENETLRDQNTELQDQQKEREQSESPDAPAMGPIQAAQKEQKWLRQELDTARAEVQRLRGMVVRLASESRGGTLPPDLAHLKGDSQPTAAPRSGAHMPAAKSSKAEIDGGPKSGARRAA